MSSRRTSSVPKEDVVFPRMLYCDSRCSQTLPGLSPALPGALECNATRRLGDGKRLILRQRVRGSVRAVRAVRNTRVFQTETGVDADEGALMNDAGLRPAKALLNNRVRRYKLRQMMMPDAEGGGKMLEVQRNVLQRVEGIDELIPENKPFERRSYERTTLPTDKRRLNGKVIIQDEEQVLKEARVRKR